MEEVLKIIMNENEMLRTCYWDSYSKKWFVRQEKKTPLIFFLTYFKQYYKQYCKQKGDLVARLNPPKNNQPLREIIYNDLRKQILSGRLLPGSRLIESTLAENLKVSRTIIREVIKQLELEGLVKITPYKGTEVSRFSLENIRELYCIQAALEGLAAGLATQRITRKEVGELRQIQRQLCKVLRQDATEWQGLNIKFHHFFLERSGNKRLQSLIKNHRDQFARYWRIILSIPGQRERNTKDHEKILKALEKGDSFQVRLNMEGHIQNAAENLTQFLAENVFLI